MCSSTILLSAYICLRTCLPIGSHSDSGADTKPIGSQSDSRADTELFGFQSDCGADTEPWPIHNQLHMGRPSYNWAVVAYGSEHKCGSSWCAALRGELLYPVR